MELMIFLVEPVWSTSQTI